ncbi:PTS sugar transporter subunit IIC [Desulfobaculum bizertense]|uniref:PTS sugar transporter subunit IIC n=1 Tax=Desulfobaculum bizertense TaxID=376490 RepID=UPI00254616EA|nr:PTS sugar transporter subunit IIC [Desulfobaculum bizertense]
MGLLERPMVQGLVWGLIFGDLHLALSVSAVFELFWLDLIPAGTFIPPNTAISNLAALSTIYFLGLTSPDQAVVPIIVAMPLSWVVARLEHVQRYWQNSSYNALLRDVKSASKKYSPARFVRKSIIQSVALYFVIFEACAIGLIVIMSLLRLHGFHVLPQHQLGWGHLWMAASFGPLLSLRLTRAYTFLIIAVCGIAAAGFFELWNPLEITIP